MEVEDSMVLMPQAGQKSKKKKTLEDIYQKKTQLEHILLRPDTYIGSVEQITETAWVYDEGKGMTCREIEYVPGLYKIFDEILVNAADNKQRDATMDTIRVDIDRENGTISVYNNGRGIPVEIHGEHKCYIPELIFGHLLTGSNYDDTVKKTTGGRNGYGAKLANIFSVEFIVETADGERRRRFKQVFRKNMSEKGSPVIKPTSEDWTRITFKPDLQKFGMDVFDDDIVALFTKRVYDIAGSTHSSTKVYLNGKRLPVRTFSDYVSLYLHEGEEIVHEIVNDRWEVVCTISNGSFQQVSFVNSINTMKGGTHVNCIADQIAQHLVEIVKKKSKSTTVRANHVKNYLFVFVNTLIENPAFDSQTKETLTTKATSFGSECKVSEKFLKSVQKTSIIEKMLSWVRFKQSSDLKKSDGQKKSKILGIPKLDDANEAGGRNSHKCWLILTEGDSAKSLAVSGFSVIGRDYYGVFPLRGKLLNVRDASLKSIKENAEISALKQILGLKQGKTYESEKERKELRYGHVMIMTDQDHDGSHIKGLLINLFHYFWPALLRTPGFLVEFVTPIVKAVKGKKSEVFFTMPEYENWKRDTSGAKGWNVKYYKGLGTSTAQEAKEYFSDLEKHIIEFSPCANMDDKIELAFSKKMIEGRKLWLQSFSDGSYVDHSCKHLSYQDFVDKELILFSRADNVRSIPCLLDGFKPGQRKILYSCFKRNLTKEIKVVQLAGYVSEHSAYHHGEQSLSMTIVNMAQTFVGANNVNLLYPGGQFGTRILGGSDSASPRYIFTKLNDITRKLFVEHDDHVLTYLTEDAEQIEPEYYVPIIPMCLINGAKGIGTGYSSDVPNYNPFEIIDNIRRHLRGEEMIDLTPWYRGFRGDTQREEKYHRDGTKTVRFHTFGKFDRVSDNQIEVTELPVGLWTQKFKEHIESLMAAKNPIIKECRDHHTDTSVHCVITFEDGKLEGMSDEDIRSCLKLVSTLNTSNMTLFDADGKLHAYNDTIDIMKSFCETRLSYYQKRKAFLVEKLGNEFDRLKNKERFILMVVHGEFIISKKKKDLLVAELEELGFQKMLKNDILGYDYLLSMPLWSLTLEKVEELRKQRAEKEEELSSVLKKSLEALWEEDLLALETELEKFYRELEEEESVGESTSDAKKRKAGGPTGVRPRTKKSKTSVVETPIPAPKEAPVSFRPQQPAKVVVMRSPAGRQRRKRKGADDMPLQKSVIGREIEEEEDDILTTTSLMARLAQRVRKDEDSSSISSNSSEIDHAGAGKRKKLLGSENSVLQGPKRGGKSSTVASGSKSSEGKKTVMPHAPKTKPIRSKSRVIEEEVEEEESESDVDIEETDSGDDFDSEVEDLSVGIGRSLPKRNRKVVSYASVFDEEDEEDEEDDYDVGEEEKDEDEDDDEFTLNDGNSQAEDEDPDAFAFDEDENDEKEKVIPPVKPSKTVKSKSEKAKTQPKKRGTVKTTSRVRKGSTATSLIEDGDWDDADDVQNEASEKQVHSKKQSKRATGKKTTTTKASAKRTTAKPKSTSSKGKKKQEIVEEESDFEIEEEEEEEEDLLELSGMVISPPQTKTKRTLPRRARKPVSYAMDDDDHDAENDEDSDGDSIGGFDEEDAWEEEPDDDDDSEYEPDF
eukprot:TRINITY_DN185_c0_g1_i1.p1 TRINITY_DN185_c0_g1~~TRINITY_DN185_c0_g1_i1.p1  ORF type:complete len:1625 (-),score=533.53 TRINITY_DN185_c0_g1_i1:176-5050(-)